MLYIVLALVVAAFGLLIAALTTANTLWAWLSVVLSVVAAALLVTDWLNGRRKARASKSARPTVVTVGGNRRETAGVPDDQPGRRLDDQRLDDQRLDDLADDRAPAEPETWSDGTAAPESDAEKTGHIEPVPADDHYAAEPAGHVAPAPDVIADDREPDEEPTDASDLLVVAGLDVEVRVVDEHPRYHLANCTWLTGRATIPVPVSEARQLGFTPCARCGPDAVLAARHRAAR